MYHFHPRVPLWDLGTADDFKTYVLATPHFDRHTSYVALSRHRDNAAVFYASDDFGGRRQGATEAEVKANFTDTLSRARPKELAHDYLELEAGSHGARVSGLVVGEWEKNRTVTTETPKQSESSPTNDLDARQQAAAERWAARQQNPLVPGQGSERIPTPSQFLERELRQRPELKRDGPEDDLEL